MRKSRFTETQIVPILKEADAGMAVNEVWRKRGISSYKRFRERLTKDIYDAVYEKAARWLQNAMDLSLLALLRRENIVSLRFADVHDNSLWFVPGKTEGSTGVRLKIEIEQEGDLAALVTRCRDSTVSPYLIHRLPDRTQSRDKRAKSRLHHT